MSHLLGAFLPERESDFQAFWYYGLLLAGVGVLAAVAGWLTASALRPLWRGGERSTAVLLSAATGTMLVLLLLMGVAALIGLAHHPATGSGTP